MMLASADVVSSTKKTRGLITCSTVYSFDDVYAPLENTEHLYQLEIGILDNTYSQLRLAAYQVLLGNQTVDEAISYYGNY